jgi:flagellar hook protein FlgE
MNMDANAPTGTSFETTVQLYDSLGKPHNATLSFQKEVTGGATPVTRWRFDITIPNNEVAGVAPTNTQKFSLLTGSVAAATPSAGALVFDNSGNLTSAYIGTDPATLPALGNLGVPPTGVTLPQLTSGASLSASTWNLLSSNGSPNITGFGGPSEISMNKQNGNAAGTMSSLNIQPDGTLMGVFSNGRTMVIAQIVLADFANYDGLVSHGSGLYTESPASGASRIGNAGEGGRGRLMSGALEQSNVDLATERTKIITFQRGYQANARIITTTDQILQETMNLMQ